MSKKLEIIGIITALIVAGISSVIVIIGFFTRDVDLIINTSRFLALSTLASIIYFGNSIYKEMGVVEHEVRMELKSKEDIEQFRNKIEKELQKYIKEIAEEEERINKEKDE